MLLARWLASTPPPAVPVPEPLYGTQSVGTFYHFTSPQPAPMTPVLLTPRADTACGTCQHLWLTSARCYHCGETLQAAIAARRSSC